MMNSQINSKRPRDTSRMEKNQILKKHKSAQSICCSIPEEIIEDILLRLPVKSLLRFRCVSKTWLSLVSSNKFIKTHLQMSQTFLAFPTFLPVSCGDKHVSCRLDLHSPSTLFYGATPDTTEEDSTSMVHKLDYPYHTRTSISIEGYSNGLCCIRRRCYPESIIFWNPSTKKSYKLPNVSVNKCPSTVSIVFGFDEVNHDYKVFAHAALTVVDKFRYMLYSLRYNSWKNIQNFHAHIIDSHDEGILFNNKFHWVIHGPRGISKIITFDLASESGGSVKLPTSVVGCVFDLCPQLSCFKRCLCLLSSDKDDYTKNHLWIMKTYGVTESWCKLVTIDTYQRCEEFDMFMPVCISPEGEVLVLHDSKLFIYNPKTNAFRPSQINNFNDLNLTGLYQESLVSPFPPDHGSELHQSESQQMVFSGRKPKPAASTRKRRRLILNEEEFY